MLDNLVKILKELTKLVLLKNKEVGLLTEIRDLLREQGETLRAIRPILGTIEDYEFEILGVAREILENLVGGEAVTVKLFVRFEGDTEEREVIDMLIHPVDRTSTFRVEAVDKFGNPAQLQAGSAAFALSDPNQGSLTPSEDGLSAKFVPAGTLGTVQIQFTGDADLGEGVKPVTGIGDITLVAGEAVNVTVTGVLDPVEPAPTPEP